MTEQEFLTDVINLADKYKILYFHSTDSRKDLGNGFPDLVLAGPYGTLFIELKQGGGTRSPEQMLWGYTLAAGGSKYGLWKPKDLLNGWAEKCMKRLATGIEE